MNYNFFITGYPGFLASDLIRQLIHDHKDKIKEINLLVLPSQEKDAKIKLAGFIKKYELPENLFSILNGDISKRDLNLSPDTNSYLQRSVTHVFHLAAIYDLAVPQELAYTVNVNGTINMNSWTKKLFNLKRYIYFSTAYVSGNREGKIFESDLVMGQSFRNQYEQTKYEAEVLVEELKTVIPTTIFRPGVVKGHSKTGETIKFDGIYFILNFMEHLKFLPIIPYLGKGEAEGNFVPSDYVLNATSYLSINTVGEGKTYHLTDPNPYTMSEIHQIIAENYLNRTPSGHLPLSLAKIFLSFSFVRKWLQVEKEAMDYFTIHSSYDSSSAIKDLAGTGITCPDLKDTIEPMISFYKKYKHDRSKHIIIN